MNTPTIYFDLDGVLADFDKRAGEILGTNDIHKWGFVHGIGAMWQRINKTTDFFTSLEMMPDAQMMIEAVRGLPTGVITALPKPDRNFVDQQKRDWVLRNVGDWPVITCLSREKADHCQRDDVLIDDRTVNKEAWTEAGGIFIHHVDAVTTLQALRALSVIE